MDYLEADINHRPGRTYRTTIPSALSMVAYTGILEQDFTGNNIVIEPFKNVASYE